MIKVICYPIYWSNKDNGGFNIIIKKFIKMYLIKYNMNIEVIMLFLLK